jgi:predicted transcriptional regulator
VKSATMTTIAKDGLGVSKASNTLKELISGLVSNKALKEDKSGKYIQYSITKSTETLKNSQTSPSTVPDGTITKDGDFTVVKKDGKFIVQGYAKEYELNDDQFLLVINGNPEYKVATAKDVIEAIQKYTESRGMVTFTVTNVKTGKQVTSSDDIGFTDKILILDITKVNKGGF